MDGERHSVYAGLAIAATVISLFTLVLLLKFGGTLNRLSDRIEAEKDLATTRAAMDKEMRDSNAAAEKEVRDADREWVKQQVGQLQEDLDWARLYAVDLWRRLDEAGVKVRPPPWLKETQDAPKAETATP